MRYLFLDNFRGFTKATVPLADVSFLVGENSTGKTSLLKMLRMFSSPQILMGADFPGEDIPLGHFSEMVSAHAKDQTYFRLGMIEDFTPKKGGLGARGLLLTYTQQESQLRISQLTCSYSSREITMRLEGDRLFYKSEEALPYINANDVSQRLLAWSAGHAEGGKGLKEFKFPKQMAPGPSQAPLAMVLSIVVSMTANKAEKSSFSFFLPIFGPPVVWIAPIRTAPRKTYDEPHTAFSPEGQHTPYIIRRMLNSEKEASKFRSFIDRVGKSSGLFDKIDIKYFGSKSDPASPFEVDAYLGDKALSLGWLGYGVSQSLPILVELLDRPKGSWFAIQQPEVHLHPRAQASLGDVFFEMAVSDDKKFLVETHSDFAIDRFRLNYRKRRRRSTAIPTSQILFFERTTGFNTVTAIPIDQYGDISPDQPEGYREFFIKEQVSLLGK
jgi:hypothetical protein